MAICLVSLLFLSVVSAEDTTTGETVSIDETNANLISVQETSVIEQTNIEDIESTENVGLSNDLQNNITADYSSTSNSEENYDGDIVAVENNEFKVQSGPLIYNNLVSNGSSTQPNSTTIYGIVDLGSNVMSLNIYLYEMGVLKSIFNDDRESVTAKYTVDGNLTPEGIEKLIQMLNDFYSEMDLRNVTIRYTFATASLRKLNNCEEVLSAVKNSNGIELQVLSGEDEALYGFIAVKYRDLTSDSEGLLIDVGGGSTEIVDFINKNPISTESMPIGSRSCYQDYVYPNILPDETDILEIQNRVEEELSKLVVNGTTSVNDLYGNGGTIYTIKRILIYLGYIDNETYIIQTSMLDTLLNKLMENATETIRIIDEVDKSRETTLMPGLVMVKQIATHFNVQEFHFCRGRLEEGVVFGLIENTETFKGLQDTIYAAAEGSTIYLRNDFLNNGNFSSEGMNITKSIIIDGNGSKIDASGYSRIFNIFATKNVVLKNIVFTGGSADYGGAIIFNNNISDCVISNCSFIANNANADGGALFFNAITNVTIENVTFDYNIAYGNGGAINVEATVVNSTIADSEFKNNSAISGTNNIALNGDGLFNLDNVTPEKLNPYYVAYLTILNVTDNVTYGQTVVITVKVEDKRYGLLNNGTVSIIINDKNYTADVQNGTAQIEIPSLNPSSYSSNVIYDNGENYTNPTQRVDFNVLKLNAVITAKNTAYVINYGGSYNVILKNVNGTVLAGKNLKFTLNGKNIGVAKTNAKGVATIKLTAKILKTAKTGKKNLVIKFTDEIYNPVSKTVKININKENTKMVAKQKAFKWNQKVKKYSVTLKNSKNKAIKNLKCTLILNGKKYAAKTNTKGVATFKITKLFKKGYFKGTVKFLGDNYYKAVSKNVKIKVQ